MGSRAQKLQRDSLKAGKDLSPYEKTHTWIDAVKNSEGYDCHDAQVFNLIQLESATYEPTKENPTNSKTVFSMAVPQDMCNMSGSLHGGAVALIFDICTSTALTACAKEGFWDTGHVSRDLNCRYLRPVPAGQKIWIESEVVHLGKRLASLTGRIKNEDGKVCYICDHQKAAVGASAL